jgi:hypothetical protein
MPIPNEADAPYADQSEIDAIDIQSMERVASGYSVLTGGAVTAQGTPDGTVAVAAGTARMNGSNKTITGGNVSVITGSTNPDGTTAAAADSTLARFSLVTLNSSSLLGALHGTPADLSPTGDGSYLAVFPAVSSSLIVLAAVFVPPGVATVASSQIQDKRIIGSVDAMHDRDHSISGSTHVGTLSVAQGLGKPQALTGAVSATNYVGATASVAPTTGTFAAGDYVITLDGKIFICTGAGTPGTWVQSGSTTYVAKATAQSFSVGGLLLGAPPTSGNYMVWRAPFACTVTNVRSHITAGTNAVVNARVNQTSNFLSSNYTNTTANAWQDGGSVQNTSISSGDDIEIMLVSTSGAVVAVNVQVDLTRVLA